MGDQNRRKHELTGRSVTLDRIDAIAERLGRITEQKKMQGESRIKEEAIASSVNAIALADLEGNLTYVDRSFLTMWGYDDDREVLGKPAIGFWEAQEKALEVVEALRSKKSWMGELVAKRKDGSVFDVQLSAATVTDETGRPICMMASFMDITQRKKAEESMNLLSTAVKTSVDAVCVASPTDRRLIFCNESFLKLWKVRGDYHDLTYIDCFDTDPDVLKKAARATMRGGWTGELMAKATDGKTFPVSVTSSPVVDSDGRTVGLLGIFRDITRRKRIEAALERRTHDLGERVKELDCLYSISSLVEKENISLEEILQGTVNLIPRSWQYPDITCARIILEGRTFQAKKFKETAWKQTSDIVVDGKKLGTVEVFYLEQKPKSDKGPFLKEESSFIDAIADRLGAITEQKKTEEELRDSLERLEILFESAPDGIYLNDLKGVFVDGNKAAERLIGYERKELVGKNFLKLKLLAREYILKAATNLAKNALGKPTGPDEFILNRKEGKQVTVEISTYPVKIKGKPLVLGIARDVTERKEAEKTVRQLAYHDPLTGLPNRRLFNDRLTLALAQAKRKKQGLAVMFLDLDYFKDVNDELGHNLGDRLLEAVGDRLRGLLRRSDTVARMGGDEFLLMLPEVTRVEDTDRIAQKILEEIRKQFVLDGHPINITTSIGIATCPKDGENADLLVKNADMAMYVAKTCGRNNCQRYSIGMNTKVVG